jgi:ectoine hydroxylase-related dioxygenase (phytanoyl-CoA dioxygenase family)
MALKPRVVKYDEARFPWAAKFTRLFGDLTQVHRERNYPFFTRETDQQTAYHKAFYDLARTAAFETMYTEFVHAVVEQHMGPIEHGDVYQRIPTFRVQLPSNVAVGEFHRDSDYGHDPHEINLWVPITPVFRESAVWIEDPDGVSYTPWPCQPGQVLIFDGAGTKHGNVPNLSGFTRVSFDFRIMSHMFYQESERRSINSKMRFVKGDFWNEFTC